MTATLTPPRGAADATSRRPLVPVVAVAGALAALLPLAGLLGLALAGWFVTDGGAHGAPRDALRAGATAWLMAHGSGVTVRGTVVTAVPLGLTLLSVWSLWRCGVRAGEEVAGHGPDAEALADGDRDWTVPVGTAVYAASYLIVAVVVGVLAATPATQPALGPVLGWGLLGAVLVGGVGLAVGSGRAAVWLSVAPQRVRATAGATVAVLRTFLLASAVLFLGALAVDLDAAMNVLSRMHTDTGDAALFVLLSLVAVPNAVVWSGCYLLGPGFLVGTGTLVSPSLVAIGPVPMFPLLAALPDNGPVPAWSPYLVVVPVLVAAVAVIRFQLRRPALTWEEGALRGVVAGVGAALVVGLLAVVTGGAVGPGRLADVGPDACDVLVHALTSFGLGGLAGGVAATWWQRRRVRREEPPAAPAATAPAGRRWRLGRR